VLAPFTDRPVEIVDRVVWLGGSTDATAYELRQRLVRDVDPGEAEIVIGLATGGGSLPRSGVWGGGEVRVEEGLAHYTRGYVVIEVDAGDICEGYRLLAHELAHVFGGVHRTGDELLMTTGGSGVEIDPLNEALFSLHADRQFGPSLAPLSGEELRTMWRLASADIEQPTTWLVVGILAARMGKAEAACGYYQRALDIAPDFAAAHANLGHAEFQLGDYDSAERRYLRALELAPGISMVHNNLAAIYYGRGRPEEAVPHLRAALILGFDVAPDFIAAVESATGQKIRQD
jgi:tetratricopeptide (TPR) repeat protein